MQLDFLIQSILKRFVALEYRINVIYHTTGTHSDGYNKLIEKYNSNDRVSFSKRKKQYLGLGDHLPFLYNLKNFKRFIKNTILFNPKKDNFKSLLENILKNSDCEFVMLNTDDGYFFNDVIINPRHFDLIRREPFDTSYRLYVGKNLEGCPEFVKEKEDYCFWNYYEEKKVTHWTFPFAVDGTIYHTKSLLKTIRPIFYHNPITLENRGVNFVKSNKLFKNGYGPLLSKLLMTKLNRVSTVSLNPTIHLSVDYLNEKFLDGFVLELDLPLKIINSSVVPNNVYLVKGKERELIYSLDKVGVTVQEALGVEGAKCQMK